MDMYGQVANTYSQELQNGVRLQSALDMQGAQQPQQLFDRFMNAYQQEYLRRKAEQEMARKQQHEDTYLKMAQTREDRANDEAKANFANWISKNYKEGRDDGVAVLLGKAAGLDENAIQAMLPKGKDVPTVLPKAAPEVVDAGDGPVELPMPTDVAGYKGPMATHQPGMGQGVAYQEGEQARKQADVDRKIQHDVWKKGVEQAKVAIMRQSADSRGIVDAARAQQAQAQADMLNARIDSGEFDLKPQLMQAQIANYYNLMSNRDAGGTKPVDPVAQELRLYRVGEKRVPKDVFGNRDPKAVEAEKEAARTRLLGPRGGAPASGPSVGTIKNGYRFKGGNPSDKNNWEKVEP